MSSIRMLGLGAALAVVAAATVAAPALAGNPIKQPSKVSIRVNGFDRLGGKVRSVAPACVPGREVHLYADYDSDGGFAEVATDTTNDAGRWRIVFKGPIPAGDYFAVVERTFVKTNECLPATSTIVSAIEI